jgi:Phage portal protein, SPP1 Gp6-like
MLEEVARERLDLGLASIQAKREVWEKEDRYFRGEHDRPFVPPGVSDEYLKLQDMSVANWIELAAKTPVQRLNQENYRTGRGAGADKEYWENVFVANKLAAREGMVYRSMMNHGRGIVSVWENDKDRSKPLVRPEATKNIHLEPDADDPFKTAWSVKVVQRREAPVGSILIPYDVKSLEGSERAYVYDDDSWMRFERPRLLSGFYAGGWILTGGGTHNLEGNPFTAFDYQQDEFGQGHSAIWPLIPAQDAINTIRFNTLLAMQFSAYRQRIATGFDPVIRDADGAPIKDANGNIQLRSMGRAAVDRLLVFPGTETKIFDLPESNLDNYIKTLGDFLTQFFALGQIPPQYLLSRMANISGDALAGAESTLTALRGDIGRMAQEGWIEVAAKANRARGAEADKSPEVGWANGETQSFASMVDAIVKLISQGFPKEVAWKMIPGITGPQLQDIEKASQKEADEKLAALPPALAANAEDASAGQVPPPPNPQEVQ